MKNKVLFGFTMAELLITIGIVGVIAAVTIPILVNNRNEKDIVTSLKKAYYTISHACELAQKEEQAPPVDWFGWTAGTLAADKLQMLNVIIPFLNISKNCNTETSSECFTTVAYKSLNESSSASLPAGYSVLLSDGMSIRAVFDGTQTSHTSSSVGSGLQNVLGYFYVDINGTKTPNQYGKDYFGFYLTQKGVMPMGSEVDNDNFETGCIGNNAGQYCTAWVLYKGNVDYLKCPSTLHWTGPITCN